MTLRATFLALAGLAVMGLGMQSASAATITVSGSGTNSDGPFSAQAVFTQTGTSLTVQLTNTTLASDTVSAKELLVGIKFSPESASIATSDIIGTYAHSLALSSSPGTIGGSGTTSGSKNWTVSSSSTTGTMLWGGAGSGTPEAIIGGTADTTTGHQVTYANLNNGGSITNETPLIYETATFSLTVPSSFDVTKLTSFTFMFNTNGDTTLTGITIPNVGDPQPTPLPASVWGGAALIGGLAAFRRMKRKFA